MIRTSAVHGTAALDFSAFPMICDGTSKAYIKSCRKASIVLFQAAANRTHDEITWQGTYGTSMALELIRVTEHQGPVLPVLTPAIRATVTLLLRRCFSIPTRFDLDPSARWH
jgi:hypothetical protein